MTAHRSVVLLIIVALGLVAVRLTTGIVYERDAPLAALVLKARPGLALERTATAAAPVARDTVLDREEPQLVYAGAYLGAMRAIPIVAGLLLVAAAVLVRRRS